MRPHKDLNVIKWSAIVSAFAIALIGCAGSDSASGTSSGSTSGSTSGSGGSTAGGLFPNVASVNLPDTPGYVQFSFLTGAGRNAPSSAVLRRVALTDVYGVEETRLQSEKLLVLNRYNSQILPLNIPNVLGQASRQFTSLDFDFISFTDSSGTVFPDVVGLPATLNADVRVIPGRQTHVPFFMDQDVVAVVDNGSGGFTAQFDQAHFNLINFAQGDPTVVRSMISDYVSFDISGLPAASRPNLSNGQVATRMFFSGDGYALAAGDPYAGVAVDFEQIIPAGQDNVLIGRCSGPASIPSITGGSTTPGTYSLVQADPTDINNAIPRRITGLQGIWKEHFRQTRTNNGILDLGYLRNVHPFEAVSIPSSDDGPRQDVIFISQTVSTRTDGTRAAVINNLYWGYLDLEAKTVKLYPAANLPTIDTGLNLAGEVRGAVVQQFTGSGAATNSPTQTRYVNFTLESPPAGFPASGTIVVLRR